MNIKEIISEKEYNLIFESRKPDLIYTEKKVKGILDKVIVTLDGTKSAAATRLARHYKQIDDHVKKLNELRDRLNVQSRDLAIDLFDASDEILTRIVETCSLTITVAKAEPAHTKTSVEEKFDFDGFCKELMSLAPELEDKMTSLIEKYKISIEHSVEVPEKLAKLSVKLKESISDKVKSIFTSFLQKIKNWGKLYDEKLEKIKNKYL